MSASASQDFGGGVNLSSEDDVTRWLGNELTALEGIQGQNPETGAGINSGKSYLGEYTTRLFGAPFQLLDSVDRRFSSINSNVGSEYLRNFLLNAPILHIRPGLPKYTGGDHTFGNRLGTMIQNVYLDTTLDGNGEEKMSFASSFLHELASQTIFGAGYRLTMRMFGFRETYYDYMQHVNYMCRSMAIFLNLTGSSDLPNFTFVSGNQEEPFLTMKWQNYRMLNSTTVQNPLEYLGSLIATVPDEIGSAVSAILEGSYDLVGKMMATGVSAIEGVAQMGSNLGAMAANLYNSNFTGTGTDAEGNDNDTIMDAIRKQVAAVWGTVKEGVDTYNESNPFSGADFTHLSEVMDQKIKDVQFMVEPVQFDETLRNESEQSAIAAAIDSAGDAIGSEIAFITNSNVDVGVLGKVMGMLGNTIESASLKIADLVQPVSGGFVTNLFTGALQSIKGQKMIYPDIYKRSSSEMNYNFTITLSSPYGDIYNYFMNIVVPLMHLVALAAPRLVTSNSTTSPYLVQAYIPGMCTCNLGLIENMVITKNPNVRHVSVNGFPLTVRVTFTIKELYHALAISSASDPTSFFANVTLNDYMSNLAGLIPSMDTYKEQRKAMFQQLDEYLSIKDENGKLKIPEFANDFASPFYEELENLIYPWQV